MITRVIVLLLFAINIHSLVSSFKINIKKSLRMQHRTVNSLFPRNNIQSSNLQTQKTSLLEKLAEVQPNGLTAAKTQQENIKNLVTKFEKLNPTKNPAKNDLMNGYWKLLYTDFDPPAESSGKLGPFVGDVYQDLDSKNLVIRNILNVKFPIISGALTANLNIPDNNTWYTSIFELYTTSTDV